MELLRSWGLEERIRAGGNDVEWLMRISTTLADVAQGETIDVGYPTRAQCATISPTTPGCVPQDHLEAVLHQHVADLPGVHLALGFEVVDLHPGGGDTHVVVRDLASGAERTVATRYVIAADGFRSVVRELLGIGFTRTPSLHDTLSVLLHAPIWDVLGEHRYGLYVVDDLENGASDGIFLPAGPPDRWVWGASWDPSRDQLADHTPERVLARIRAGVGRDVPIRVVSTSAFSFTAGMAECFRVGDVFLVGDAAHTVTPRGGTGLNSAIADGFDLGWKLSWVLSGWASDDLLDSYEAERRPVVEHNFARSLDPNGSRRPVDELNVDLGGRIRHVWVDSGSARTSTLDLVGAGLTRFTGPEGCAPRGGAIPWTGPPLTERRLDPLVARSLGIGPGDGLLVRPDATPLLA
jgi:2-polyprenyl-6-methoxyphenol hydroxylase-like FAD-dependent oxidoreductase